ncbi:hypothetical protein A2U01_0114048, partial [Trifolium medium]|nr:hypothetical protein [Trifolium medium]
GEARAKLEAEHPNLGLFAKRELGSLGESDDLSLSERAHCSSPGT